MNARKFQSEKGTLAGIIIWSCIILIVASIGLLATSLAQGNFITILIMMATGIPSLFLLLWIWFDTSYGIDGAFLYYQSGPFQGKVAIQKINTIHKNRTLWVGMKPALAQNGLIIKYGKWSEIYISPEDKDTFIAHLKHVNDKIEVLGKS